MTGPGWYRVPHWCMSIHDEHSAPRARAWVYLLGAWQAGDDPPVREVRRVTGFGGGRADALVRDVAAWAVDAGARVPERLAGGAGQQRGRNGAGTGRPDVAETPTINEERGANGAATGQERGAHARDPLLSRRDEDVETETESVPSGTQVVPPEPVYPSWVPAARQLHGETRAAALAAVVSAVEALRGGAVNPHRCAGDAREVLGLWRAMGHQPLAELAAELVLVIGWAQRSPDQQAARDIRAEGWEAGTDRSRAMATICRRDRWADRLDAARRWTAQGEPISGPQSPPALATPSKAAAGTILGMLRRADPEPPQARVILAGDV